MRTDTYDEELWQLVPRQMTQDMYFVLVRGLRIRHEDWTAVLAAAPTPPASTQSVALEHGGCNAHRAECQHRIADARNAVVKSGYICVDCGAPFSAADHSGESAQSEALYTMDQVRDYADTFHQSRLIVEQAALDDLSTLVRRLVRELRKASPSNDLSQKALDYLERAGLKPNVLRESAQSVEPVAWIARWHGSNPERGWSIYAGRDCIAYIGGDEGMSEAISEIVAAHNKCFDCDGGPCVMNCSGRASRISDATKGGEA